MSREQFINDMKSQFGMNDRDVLQAIREDPQHDFIMETQNVDSVAASNIIEDAEYYLMITIDNPCL